MDKKTIPSFDWDDKTEETKAPKMDEFAANVAGIRDALKKRPTRQGYLALIGELLDRELLDEAGRVTDEFKKWVQSEKRNK